MFLLPFDKMLYKNELNKEIGMSRVIWLAVVVVLIAHSVLASTQNVADLACPSILSSRQWQLDLSLMQAILEPDADYNAIRALVHRGANPNVWMSLSDFDFNNEIKFSEINYDYVFIDLEELISSNKLVEMSRLDRERDLSITPLHLAVRLGHRHIVYLLLEEFHVKDTAAGLGMTAFSLLAYQKNLKNEDRQFMAQSFMESEPTEMEIGTAFHNAVMTGDTFIAETIFKYARESRMIKGFRDNIRLLGVKDWITRSKRERIIKRRYRIMFEYFDFIATN